MSEENVKMFEDFVNENQNEIINEDKDSEKFTKSELKNVDPNDEYKVKVKFSSESGDTKHIGLDESSAKVIKKWLEDNYKV